MVDFQKYSEITEWEATETETAPPPQFNTFGLAQAEFLRLGIATPDL